MNAIIIGASSGIGKALAHELSAQGYTVGLTARRIELLKELQGQLAGKSFIKQMDVAECDTATGQLEELITEMGGMDLIVINAGVGFKNPDLDFKYEKFTIDVNVSGFTAMATAVFRYFQKKGSGHIVGISSIAAIRGAGGAPAYNASKSFELVYLQGLQHRAAYMKLPIAITIIQPGFVETQMIQGGKNLFWVASPETAAKQIYTAIKHKRKQAYVTRRWRILAWLSKITPDFIYHKVR